MSILIRRSAPFVRNFVSKFCGSLCPENNIGVRYYWRRRNAFSELSSAVQALEDSVRDMDREMNQLFSNIQRASPFRIPQLFSPFEWGRAREIPVISSDADGRRYKVEMDMQGMAPEDIKITLKDQELTVTARRSEKRDDGSRYEHEHSYHYTLPKEVDVDTIRSSLTDGVLTIEAQLPALEAKEIPVTIESSSGSENKADDGVSKK
ncbi:alpha-crystallin A chain-like [Stegodyphus dumicola]|uniref:alpha-crystallin A chain-like n=1 Tax=Stegodyphus dumicola TaxID=202533 RepID=UPI0015B34D31|nr:alpha-crystallin A chain-like [Stegodyphus dumicola]